MTILLKIIASVLIFLPLFADGQQWSVDLKMLGSPGPSQPSRFASEIRDRDLKVAFTASNKVLVSYVLNKPDKSLLARNDDRVHVRLIALLLESATGKLIRRHEWEAEKPPTPEIARLPNGNFILLLDDDLEMLDDSFSVLRKKSLGLNWSSDPWRGYDVSVPVTGHFFAVTYYELLNKKRDVQIFDADTLDVADEWNSLESSKTWIKPQLYADIVLSGVSESAPPLIKTLGGTWQPFNPQLPHTTPYFLTAKQFIASYSNPDEFNTWCWTETDEKTILSNPVCYPKSDSFGRIVSSQNGSIIAVGIGRLTAWDAALDRYDKGRVVVYAEGSHRKLLTTSWKRGHEGESGGDFALSLDGSLLAVLNGEQLDIYRVPRQ